MRAVWLLLLLAGTAPAGPRTVKVQPVAAAACAGAASPRRGEGPAAYEQRVCLSARFATAALNVGAYLDSLELEQPQGGPRTVVVVRDDALGRARWRISIFSAQKPTEGRIAVRLGTDELLLDLRALALRREGERLVAAGAADVVVADPSWPVLHSARFLPLEVPGSTLLQVVVENRSPSPAVIEFVDFEARRPSDVHCAVGDGGRPVQKIRLSWPQAVTKGDSTGPAAAWTTLGGHEVPVETRFRPAGCSNGFEFGMRFPVDDTVAPGAVMRLEYEFEETQVEDNAGMGSGIPSDLSHWETRRVTLESSSQPIRPSSRSVSTYSMAVSDRGPAGGR